MNSIECVVMRLFRSRTELTHVFTCLNGSSSQDFLLREVHAVPDHGEVELRVQVHVVALQEGRENLLVEKGLPANLVICEFARARVGEARPLSRTNLTN